MPSGIDAALDYTANASSDTVTRDNTASNVVRTFTRTCRTCRTAAGAACGNDADGQQPAIGFPH